MTDNRTERLFCCECGTELPGEPARVVPPLQPGGKGVGGSTRPHVWCHRCWRAEQEEAKARPKPHELEQDPAFVLHRYIWTVGEGRTDKEIRDCWGTYLWGGEKLFALLRRLTEAGKIEKRGDRRVALCSPWSCCETVEGLAHDVPIHEQEPGRRCPHDGGYCHHNCAPGECYREAAGMSLSTPHEGYPHPDEQDPVFKDATEALPKPEELQADRYAVYGSPETIAEAEGLRPPVERFALGPDGRVYVSVALEQRLKNIEVMLVTLLERAACAEKMLQRLLDGDGDYEDQSELNR